MPAKRVIGGIKEKEAEDYLKNHDYRIIEKNFYIRGGEADIIAINDDNLCFVEVKYRANADFGTAAESVTASKIRKLIKTAKYYITVKKEYASYNIRFDVLAIDGDNINLIKGAFDAC